MISEPKDNMTNTRLIVKNLPNSVSLNYKQQVKPIYT